MKSFIKVMCLMFTVVTMTFAGAYFLKVFGIKGGVITRVIPFMAMVIGTFMFLSVYDKKKFSDIGLGGFWLVFDEVLILAGLAFVPIIVSIGLGRNFEILKAFDLTVIATILYCFLIGFSEELLFRGYIFHEISMKKSKVLISALAFAGFHFISPEFNLILFILYFIFGVLKAYMLKVIKNLWPLIVFHMFWDLGAVYTNGYSDVIIDLLSLFIVVIVIVLLGRGKNSRINSACEIIKETD